MGLGDYRIFRNVAAWHRNRAENDIFDLSGAGAPTDGTTGAAFTGPQSTYRDITNGIMYINYGTKAAPVWINISAAVAGKGIDFALRTRVSTANVNAGLTLLAAIPGWRYRLLDCYLIAIGAGAGGTTTVDILGTQAAGSVKLLAVAIAALTQSAIVRHGATNATVLADGASFVQNDVNTPITINKTGAALTGSTFIDVIASYAIEK